MNNIDSINKLINNGENRQQNLANKSREEKALLERSNNLLLARAKVIQAEKRVSEIAVQGDKASATYRYYEPLRDIEPAAFAKAQQELQKMLNATNIAKLELTDARREYDNEILKQNEPIEIEKVKIEKNKEENKVTYMDIETRGEGLFSGTGRMFPGLNHPIILYGNNKDSMIANIAKTTMNKFGFTNLYILEDGLEGWREKGLPTEGECDVMLIREYIR